jgi:DNA polymerase-4
VSTGEPLWQARQKCPDIVFLPPHYELYEKYSYLVREIYYEFTDMIEPFGLDECWLDVTGSVALFGDGETIANTIRERIKRELGLTVSVGVSFNKVFAKLGSDMKKPDATTVISREDFREKIWSLPACDLLFIGKRTYEKLYRCGYRTIGDVACANVSVLKCLFGKNGVVMHEYANGLDSSPVLLYRQIPPPKSVSNSTTPPRDLVTEEDISLVLYRLCDNVSMRMRRERVVCKTVQIYVRYTDLCSVTRQKKQDFPNRTSRSLYATAKELIKRHGLASRPIRSIGVCATDLESSDVEQLSFCPGVLELQRIETLESEVDRLRERYGEPAIRRGISLTDEVLSGDLDAPTPAYFGTGAYGDLRHASL